MATRHRSAAVLIDLVGVRSSTTGRQSSSALTLPRPVFGISTTFVLSGLGRAHLSRAAYSPMRAHTRATDDAARGLPGGL